jgi:hypothetical protein
MRTGSIGPARHRPVSPRKRWPGTRAEHTAVSFRVTDVLAAVPELEGRGVGLKTVDHVCVLGSEKAAWFEDPEGNLLCLHEDIG